MKYPDVEELKKTLAAEGIVWNEDDTVAVKKCPFTHPTDLKGRETKCSLSWEDPKDGDGLIYWVECHCCGAQGPYEGDPVLAVRSWENRKPTAATPEEKVRQL